MKCGCSTVCDGCCEQLADGERAFCEGCRTLPDRHVEPSEVADALREWCRRKGRRLTDIEHGILGRVADCIENGVEP